MNVFLKSLTFAGLLGAGACTPETPEEHAAHVARDIERSKFYVLAGEDPTNICYTRECVQEMREMMDSVRTVRAEEGQRRWEERKKAVKTFFSF